MDSFLWNCQVKENVELKTPSGQKIDEQLLQLFVYRTYSNNSELESSNLTFLYYVQDDSAQYNRSFITAKFDPPKTPYTDIIGPRESNTFPTNEWPSQEIAIDWENVKEFNEVSIELKRMGQILCPATQSGQMPRKFAEGSLKIDDQLVSIECVQSGTFRENVTLKSCAK